MPQQLRKEVNVWISLRMPEKQIKSHVSYTYSFFLLEWLQLYSSIFPLTVFMDMMPCALMSSWLQCVSVHRWIFISYLFFGRYLSFSISAASWMRRKTTLISRVPEPCKPEQYCVDNIRNKPDVPLALSFDLQLIIHICQTAPELRLCRCSFLELWCVSCDWACSFFPLIYMNGFKPKSALIK